MLLLISMKNTQIMQDNSCSQQIKSDSYLQHQAFLVYLNVFQRYQKRDSNLLMDHPEKVNGKKSKKILLKNLLWLIYCNQVNQDDDDE